MVSDMLIPMHPTRPITIRLSVCLSIFHQTWEIQTTTKKRKYFFFSYSHNQPTNDCFCRFSTMMSTSRRLVSPRTLLRLSASLESMAYNKREYHTSGKREILPLILGIGVLAVGRYSWRAIKRMEEEWEEYQWLLQEYEKKNGTVLESTPFPDGTIAIDLGTIHLKMAHAQQKSEIVANRSGGRYTFAGLVRDGDEVFLGQQALENFYKSEGATLPYQDNSVIQPVITQAVQDLQAQKNATKFRSILTIPPISDLPEVFFTSLSHATLIPEPVAAIWGAQQQNLLPNALKGPILVVDIGGFRTTLSIVQKNLVQTSVSLNFGGEIYADKVVHEIIKDKPSLANDPMAMQRVHMAAISAVLQYNSNTQAQIHIPYISMDMETRKPQHLDIVISRSIIESQLQEEIVQNLVPNVLSNAMPVPTNLTTTWMSVLTQLLTQVNLSPMQISHVLLVGGGAKQRLMETSLQDCLRALQGNSDNLILPDSRSELVALGAVSMLPNYDYNPEKGLVRMND